MFSTIIFAAVLIVISLVMLTLHYNTWQAADHGGLPERERVFLQRQFRRRTNASGAIGLVGILLISGLWIPEESIVNFLFTCGILFLLMWISLIAISDLLASRFHYESQQAVQSAQIAALQAVIKREAEKLAEGNKEPPPGNESSRK